MMTRRRKTVLALGCLAVATAFVFSIVEASSVHTDDGCQVELHCFACHWAFAGNAVVALPVGPGPALAMAGRVVASEVPLVLEAPSPEPATRGPPTL